MMSQVLVFLPPIWKTLIESLSPGFSLSHPWLLLVLGEWISVSPLPSLLSPSTSAFKINKNEKGERVREGPEKYLSRATWMTSGPASPRENDLKGKGGRVGRWPPFSSNSLYLSLTSTDFFHSIKMTALPWHLYWIFPLNREEETSSLFSPQWKL